MRTENNNMENELTKPAGESGGIPQPQAGDALPKTIRDISELNCDLGIDYCGDEDDYMFALETYVDSIPEKAERIEKCLIQENYKDYAIVMHSLKSMSRSIGALAVSDMAKDLELSAKSGDVEKLKDRTESFTQAYRNLGQKIKACL